jgi:hypothetical protein
VAFPLCLAASGGMPRIIFALSGPKLLTFCRQWCLRRQTS